MLRALPKPGCPVRAPGHAIPTHGQPVRRLGLKFDLQKGEYYPTGKVTECDESAEGARELVKAIAQGAAWAADEETAKAAGVPFVELEIGDDKWARPKAQPVAAPKTKKGDL